MNPDTLITLAGVRLKLSSLAHDLKTFKDETRQQFKAVHARLDALKALRASRRAWTALNCWRVSSLKVFRSWAREESLRRTPARVMRVSGFIGACWLCGVRCS